uniref:Uncharacterized protein n=1 Tax=Daphnia galeata TaxID=27404 RepID=A0A8J2RW26_9CRUS|nr:unnamed protein product [Daphnia galeata]
MKQVPAISLAYEAAKFDTMKRRPCNAQIDKLVNDNGFTDFHVLWSNRYDASFSWFLHLFCDYGAENGLWPKYLFDLLKRWDSKAINDLLDSFGHGLMNIENN